MKIKEKPCCLNGSIPNKIKFKPICDENIYNLKETKNIFCFSYGFELKSNIEYFSKFLNYSSYKSK